MPRLLLAAVAAFLACAPPPPPPVLGEVPPFALVDQDGAPVTRETLAARPWVADFIFTRCTLVCPRMSEVLGSLARAHRGQPVRFVSVSVDPEHDTPAVLARYAERVGAEPGWRFLTGDPEAVRALTVGGFKLGLERSDDPAVPVGASVIHSSRLALVDADGAIRGYYDAFDADDRDRLDRDLAAISGARAAGSSRR